MMRLILVAVAPAAAVNPDEILDDPVLEARARYLEAVALRRVPEFAGRLEKLGSQVTEPQASTAR